ncbi:hypothetical protein D6783_02010 [Candidatus Woesearchaeota archaeon]|nr:MAG: hypothetical protein D6783_02010 [Candidatus Woesearchaeota archaeon]
MSNLPQHHTQRRPTNFFATLLVTALVLLSCTSQHPNQPLPFENGTITAFFCPHDCNNTLTNLAAAYPSMTCAFYDLDSTLPPTLFPNTAHIFVYTKNFEGRGTPLTTPRTMHNKFCILNDHLVWTGSMNPTSRGIYQNNNNLVLINSTCITQNYQQELDELLSGNDRQTPCPVVNLSGAIIETAFCPEDRCKEALLHHLSLARQSIHFMTFSFTLEEAANLLINKHHAGVNVTGIFEKRQQHYSVKNTLENAGITTYWDANPASMHHKVFIIDEKTVITGSMNPSKNGVQRNDENLVIIHDKATAAAFLKEYFRLQTRAEK